MVEFLMKTTEDINYLLGKPRSDEYLEEYTRCLNPIKAMDTVDRRHEAMKANSTEPYMVIRITGKADVILAKQLLENVNYKVLEEM